jgi:hypothetical protein
MVTIDGIKFKKSTRKNKKYDAFKDGKKLTSFGDKRYHHYKDKIGMYSSLNHLDTDRRRRYYARHGRQVKKYSAKYFSHKYLW